LIPVRELGDAGWGRRKFVPAFLRKHQITMIGLTDFLLSLDAKLMAIAMNTCITERERMVQSIQECRACAVGIERWYSAQGPQRTLQQQEFNAAKNKILVYIVYYDRVIRFLDGDASPGTGQVDEYYPEADYFDWRGAQVQARQLFVNYIKEYKNMKLVNG
jgi:hypothetical protein